MNFKKYLIEAAVCIAGFVVGGAITYSVLNKFDNNRPELEKIVMGNDNLEGKLTDSNIVAPKIRGEKDNCQEIKGFRDIDTIKITVNHKKDSKPIDISYNINADYAVVVSKRDQRSYLFNLDNMNLEKKYIISTAKKSGPKRVIGDNKTPEGFFKVTDIKKKEGAIGPYAVYYDCVFSKDRINNGVLGTPMHGIKSDNLGKEASHGCIRYSKWDITNLIKYINKNDFVIIYDGPERPEEMLLKQLKRLN